MDLDGLLGGAQLSRNLFVQQTGHHQRKDLPLARGQRVIPPPDFRAFRLLRNRIPRATDGAANRVQEFVARERFLEEIHRPCFHGPHARGHVPVTGDEDDGNRVSLPIERLLELEAVQSGQADIQDET